MGKQKSLDLQKEHFQRKPQQPSVLRPIKNVPGVKGQFPMQPGQVVLTEHEKKKLAQFGWKEGDPLPGNIAELIKQARAGIAEDIRTAKPPQDHPVLKVPEPVDIADIDPAKRQELEGHLAQFKEMAPQIEAAAQAQVDMSQLSPEVQKAVRDAADGGVQVVDSSQQDPVKNLQDQIDVAEGRKAPRDTDRFSLEEDEEPSETQESPTGAMNTPKHCPRCGHDVSSIPKPPPKEDQLAYVAAILGSQPFVKDYSLFGGRVLVCFRQLTTDLAEMAFEQVAHEVRVGERGEDAFKQVMTYRMILSMENLTINGEKMEVGKPVRSFLDEPIEEGVKQTDVLPIIVGRLQKAEPLNQNSIWRACYDAYMRFNELTDDLDARASEPDFWNAIES